MPSEAIIARNRLGALTRTKRPVDDPVVVQARRDLAAARVEARIRRAIADAPPLPAEARQRIRELVAPLLSDDAGAE